MRDFKSWSVALLAFAFSPLAQAQTPPAQNVASADAAQALFQIQTCPEQDTSHQADDERQVASIVSEGQRGGFPALETRRADLEAILSRAPACFPQAERRGDAVLVRSIDPQAGMTMTLALVAAPHPPHEHVSVSVVQDTYPLAALLLGSYLNQMHDFNAAIAALDRGLALQPHEQYLATEKAAALQQLHRSQDAVNLLQDVLADESQSLVVDRARLERILGENLIDLNRLDDAEAALRESIRLQPNNPNAEHELAYVASVRAGAAHHDPQLVTTPFAPTPTPNNPGNK